MGNYQEGSSPMGASTASALSLTGKRALPLTLSEGGVAASNIAELKKLLGKLERGESLDAADTAPTASTSTSHEASDIDIE